MGLESLGDLELNIILSNLGAEDTARASCVSKKLRESASEDSLWSHICAQDLALSQPLDPLGNPLPSFRESYHSWRESFSMYPWSLVKRVKRCWGRLRNWLTLNFPEAEATLKKGASESDIQELERILKVKLPLPTRILYRFYDGQEFTDEHYSNSLYGSPLGLIGGYTFYNRSVNVYLLPLRQIITRTEEIRRHPGFSGKSKYIAVAASSTFINKLFLLNCNSGQLFVGTKNLSASGEMLPCVPKELIRSVHDLNGDQQQDAMLLWLEEHGHRLEKGIIKLREEKKFRSISLFPEEPPSCITAITSSVKVRASAVLIPEFSDLQDDEDKYLFTYSIRMSLLPEGCYINGMTFGSCQLYWRHWVIRANNHVVSDVNGEAVIGKFPLLRPGEKEFIYESCTPLPSSEGSVEGYFTFVPGSLSEPKGDLFKVAVAQFPLQLPDYIF
ncbi:F-box domain containing protein [Trema orientale]|uniref:F-box domain containing protein n=1 Tax=Trema orientale TaxID=63057 RepID=A0A2P5G0M2_TREOI|nr:F-box domain containing protein [Trema orientale]